MLTVDSLRAVLWQSAEVLRGSLSVRDQLSCIFGLLFLKYISDSSAEAAQPERIGTDLANGDAIRPRFRVPKQACWSSLRSPNEETIGVRLHAACVAIERVNPLLRGVLTSINFSGADESDGGRQHHKLIEELMAIFSGVYLRSSILQDPDMLGSAFEWLLDKFSDQMSKGEGHTPPLVTKLLVELIAPAEDMAICDPACGLGGTLIECARYAAKQSGKRLGHDRLDINIQGQELDVEVWSLCRMNLILHGLDAAVIERGDTLRAPRLLDRNKLTLFDRVLVDPPFNLDRWGYEMAKDDPYGRFQYGVPPKNTADYAFVQHAVATLRAGGQAALLMPLGTLFRASEKHIRQRLLEADLFESVIVLRGNVFPRSALPAAILTFRRNKVEERRGQVLLMDAGLLGASHQINAPLDAEAITKLASAFHEYRDVTPFARVVGLAEITASDYSLDTHIYFKKQAEAHAPSTSALKAQLEKKEALRDGCAAEIDRLISELNTKIRVA